ncbi:hypothetical protein ACFVAV_18070 [Nocardia sp. NPDC057663]|uniref:ATP-dependent DNA ligase n=1 Tax=Nocardia sp. NPDC057663 TaxID=3346201 RepID=UPI00366A7234
MRPQVDEPRRADAILVLGGARVRVPPNWSLDDHDAEQLLHTAAGTGLEGIVCKKADSIYEPGCRSSAWTKVVLRLTTEAIIVGAVFCEELHRMHDQVDQFGR